MALHLRAWALDAQILGAEIERLAVVERNGQSPAVLVQAQFGRPRLRRCITHVGLLANELGAEPRLRRRRSIAPAPTITNAHPEQTAFPSSDVLLTWRKIIGPPRGSGGWSSRAPPFHYDGGLIRPPKLQRRQANSGGATLRRNAIRRGARFHCEWVDLTRHGGRQGRTRRREWHPSRGRRARGSRGGQNGWT